MKDLKKRKQVRLSNGKAIKFDAALVATGGTPKRLNIPGSEDVYTIRHSEDVQKIRSKAKRGSKAVIIGTSFIGLETASALAQKGVHVTVVGEEERPFARQFGERVEHDLPIAEDGGICVDESLRAANRIWVAGDIATVRGTRIEHWRLAQQHGMVATRQMMGSPHCFNGVPFFWTLHFGKELNYLGHADEWDKIVYHGNVKKLNFLAFYVKEGRVLAVLSCGKEQETAMLSEMMRNHLTIEDIHSWLRSPSHRLSQAS
jgi:NAD(P)H-nitrite reductase large subunit